MAIYLGTNKVDGSIIVDPGSEVSYIPTVQSGTELGKLNIDGFNSSIYAPTIPTNVSAFTNDAGYGAVVELTQAEYDALSTVEKNNGKIYYVTDATGTYLTASEVSYGSSSVQDTLDDLGDDVSSLGSGDTIINRVRYVKGFYSTARADTMVHRIQDFLSIIGDSDNICIFDVIINNAGQFRFSGYIYSGQLYGAGIVYRYDGNPVYWRRSDGNDLTIILQNT